MATPATASVRSSHAVRPTESLFVLDDAASEEYTRIKLLATHADTRRALLKQKHHKRYARPLPSDCWIDDVVLDN